MPFKFIFTSTIIIFLIKLLRFVNVNGQVATGGQSDRTQQELALLGWTSGVRMAYCQSIAIIDLVDPFREAIARMLNRHCRSPIACGLRKSVTFNKFHIVLLDGFPRREHRALNFRFFVVLPHDAIPMEKRPEKPMIPSLILSDMLNSQLSELTHGLGWQVISYEQYPRFDPTTSFFNRFLIPIAISMGLCMIFLAYWVSLITSGSSLYANGWLVRGSSGGKNAALRRTMQIIEEQKYRFALYDSQTGGMPLALGLHPVAPKTVVIYKSNASVQEVHAPPKSLATSSSSPKTAEMGRAMPIYPAPERISQQQMTFKDKKLSKEGPASKKDRHILQHEVSSSEILPSPSVAVPMRRKQLNQPVTQNQTAAYDEKEMAEMADCVPEIVVVSHPRDSSMDTIDTASTQGRKLSLGQGHRRSSRRFSFGDDKRRKSFFPGNKDARGNKANQDRQKRWKASSIALSKFSIVGSRK